MTGVDFFLPKYGMCILHWINWQLFKPMSPMSSQKVHNVFQPITSTVVIE